MPTRFARYVLRTTSVADARRFYGAVLGHAGDGIVDLPAAAAAQGAPPHWMGYIASRHAAAPWLAQGATRLGPERADGVTLLRDAGGAVQAVMPDADSPSAAGVVWHQLITPDPDRAASRYAEVLGWSFAAASAGAHRTFAWSTDGAPVGWISDMRTLPGAHPHWLFYFGVDDLDAAATKVEAEGGLVVAIVDLDDGRRLAPCEDAQGAAFGLMQT